MTLEAGRGTENGIWVGVSGTLDRILDRILETRMALDTYSRFGVDGVCESIMRRSCNDRRGRQRPMVESRLQIVVPPRQKGASQLDYSLVCSGNLTCIFR